MRSLVWAFAGRTYHIVVHLMSWFKYIRIIIIVTWSDLLYHVDWNVSGDLMVWSRLLDVIQYARSSYCYDNIFIIYPFPTLFWLYKSFWSLIPRCSIDSGTWYQVNRMSTQTWHVVGWVKRFFLVVCNERLPSKWIEFILREVKHLSVPAKMINSCCMSQNIVKHCQLVPLKTACPIEKCLFLHC